MIASIYLLRCHSGIAIHALEHRLLRLPISVCWIGWYLRSVYPRLWSIFLLGRHLTVSHGSILRMTHMLGLWLLRMIGWRLLLNIILGWYYLTAGGRLRCTYSTRTPGPLSRSLCVAGGFLPRYDVNEEVEHVRFCKSGSNIRALQGPSLVLLGVYPCPHGQFSDEDVTALCKQYWGFRRYHLDIRISLHDLLDSSQRKLMEFVIVRVILEGVDSLLPIGRQDVAVVAIEPLTDLSERVSVF